MKMIELLNKIANDTLEDGTRVIIKNELYCYNKEDERLYKSGDNSTYRIIRTNELNMEVELIDKQETQQNKIEEIDKKSLKDTKIYGLLSPTEVLFMNKMNEIIRVLNNN